MVLTTCPECGRGVSSTAPYCPHCAEPFASEKGADPEVRHRGVGVFKQGLNYVYAVLLAFACLAAVGFCTAMVSVS